VILSIALVTFIAGYYLGRADERLDALEKDNFRRLDRVIAKLRAEEKQ